MRKFFIMVILALACFMPQTYAQITMPKPLYEPTVGFVENDFRWSMEKGSGVIAGKAQMKAQGGFIQTAEGEEVILVARTPYTDEIVKATRMDGFFDKYDNVRKHPDYNHYRRVQTAVNGGQFRFENLPAGEWYIATRVIWYTRDQYGKVSLHGGLVWGLIDLKDGETRENLVLNSTSEIAR
ncbi:MAG: hypothetical protein OQK24_06725 [Magnetovibrio sp.]|nr:hypothetical protein [Magnetovibrio sp.]